MSVQSIVTRILLLEYCLLMKRIVKLIHIAVLVSCMTSNEINLYKLTYINVNLPTCRLLRLAGLVGEGLGDFPDRGVDSWLPAVPLAVGTAEMETISIMMKYCSFSVSRHNRHLNYLMMETCSYGTSHHFLEKSDPAKWAAGHMMQTLPPCIL